MLKILGATELIAADRDSFVETAARLGRDRDERHALATRITERRGELFEREEPVRALEEFLVGAAGDRSTA
jgi:predicted O-linked N-acetylglucosamine transferase (SPINDLY family)